MKQLVVLASLISGLAACGGSAAVRLDEGWPTAPPDYEHYVTQQLRPIADAILRLLPGPDFDDLTGARKQLSLF